jgi:quinohemoprotein ethanol dehydrogenase
MMHTTSLPAAALVAITAVCLTPIQIGAQTESFVPVTQAMQVHPDPSDWLHISRTYDEHRFSPLKQINKSNVAQLRMVWSRGLPVGTQESTPLV